MKYLITGAGPVGRAVARELTARGHECIIMSRHGSALDLGPQVQHITGDATQKESYPADVDGIVHCIHAAYNAEAWRTLLIPAEDTALRIAAERAIPIVFPESIYGFDPSYETFSPGTPLTTSRQGKLGVRAALINTRLASPARAVSVVAADLFGPDSGPGCVYHQLIIGKRIPLALFNAHTKHSVTYLPDFGRALADALLDPTSPPIISVPCAPAITQAEFAHLAGCRHSPITLRPWMLKLGGLFNSDLNGLLEMSYLWEHPSILSGATAQWEATPIEQALRETLRASSPTTSADRK